MRRLAFSIVAATLLLSGGQPAAAAGAGMNLATPTGHGEVKAGEAKPKETGQNGQTGGHASASQKPAAQKPAAQKPDPTEKMALEIKGAIKKSLDELSTQITTLDDDLRKDIPTAIKAELASLPNHPDVKAELASLADQQGIIIYALAATSGLALINFFTTLILLFRRPPAPPKPNGIPKLPRQGGRSRDFEMETRQSPGKSGAGGARDPDYAQSEGNRGIIDALRDTRTLQQSSPVSGAGATASAPPTDLRTPPDDDARQLDQAIIAFTAAYNDAIRDNIEFDSFRNEHNLRPGTLPLNMASAMFPAAEPVKFYCYQLPGNVLGWVPDFDFMDDSTSYVSVTSKNRAVSLFNGYFAVAWGSAAARLIRPLLTQDGHVKQPGELSFRG